MKRIVVDALEKLMAQLQSLHSEISVISKKNPNGPINNFKVKLINSTLARANAQLGEKYEPFADFKQFGEEDLPSSSDVTFILSQYMECAEKLRSDNVELRYGAWYWIIDDGQEPSIRTSAPKKLQ